jgi:carboxylesterase type B
MSASAASVVPSAQLDDGSVITGGRSSDNIEYFKGIPFAEPPVGTLRFQPPVKYAGSLDGYEASDFGETCYEQNPFYFDFLGQLPADVWTFLQDGQFFGSTNGSYSENCLFLNVFRPAGTTSADNLPVMVWIYGGGFIEGSSSSFDPTNIIAESVAMGQPVVVVTMNYRVGAYGFLGGKEVKETSSGNWGLLDQRLSIEWVADNISGFGGDPDKVLIFGESAGSISVAHQMIMYDGDNTYKGKPLFRAAIMQSGSVVPTKGLDSPHAQAIYDELVSLAGCETATDTFTCLQNLSADDLNAAQDQIPSIFSYKTLALPFLPRWDGQVFSDQVYNMVRDGKYAKVPFIIGDQEDEGTIFSLTTYNVTDNAKFSTWLEGFFDDMTQEELDTILELYPDDAAAGSPFDTGVFNEIYPQYKRIAAVQGDFVFQWPRRFMLRTATDVKSWSFLSKVQYGTPIIGTFHSDDNIYLWDLGSVLVPAQTYKRYFIAFANNLDPNYASGELVDWPEYSSGAQNLVLHLTYNDLEDDNYRSAADVYVNGHISDLLF